VFLRKRVQPLPKAERTYTTDADFEEGVSTGVEIVENQLQLSDEPVTLPFIWVPGDEGVVSPRLTQRQGMNWDVIGWHSMEAVPREQALTLRVTSG